MSLAELHPLRQRTTSEAATIECVVRGYLAGSGWKEYRLRGTVCGEQLPTGLNNAAALPEPIFTPATKAETGHDENISFDAAAEIVGQEMAEEALKRSIAIYQAGVRYAADRGIVIADTKFEFGRFEGQLLLIDEIMTPDSSRFWPAEAVGPDGRPDGSNPPSYDKQFVRDWAESTGWDKESAAPSIPDDVVSATRRKYIDAFEHLTGEQFLWA